MPTVLQLAASGLWGRRGLGGDAAGRAEGRGVFRRHGGAEGGGAEALLSGKAPARGKEWGNALFCFACARSCAPPLKLPLF